MRRRVCVLFVRAAPPEAVLGRAGLIGQVVPEAEAEAGSEAQAAAEVPR